MAIGQPDTDSTRGWPHIKVISICGCSDIPSGAHFEALSEPITVAALYFSCIFFNFQSCQFGRCDGMQLCIPNLKFQLDFSFSAIFSKYFHYAL